MTVLDTADHLLSEVSSKAEKQVSSLWAAWFFHEDSYVGFYGCELRAQDRLLDPLRKRIRQRTISYQQNKSPRKNFSGSIQCLS